MDDPAKQNLMQQLGIDRLPPEDQEEAFTRIGGIIFSRVMARALDVLAEKDQEELDRIIAANPADGAAVFMFLSQKMPGFEAIMDQEAAAFRDDAMGVMDRVKD